MPIPFERRRSVRHFGGSIEDPSRKEFNSPLPQLRAMTSRAATLVAIGLFIHSPRSAEDVFEWEGRLPAGAETNLVELNRAAGNEEAAEYISREIGAHTYSAVRENRDRVEPQTLSNQVLSPFEVEMEPLVLSSWKPKLPDGDELVEVVAKKLPPDMLGSGPFLLIRSSDAYYMLTEKNFARIFGPVTEESQVLPYVRLHHSVFGEPFFSIVTDENEEYRGNHKPPAVTTVTAAGGRFKVNLILCSPLHRACFAGKRLFVSTNGTVKVTRKIKVIKDLGPGMYF